MSGIGSVMAIDHEKNNQGVQLEGDFDPGYSRYKSIREFTASHQTLFATVVSDPSASSSSVSAKSFADSLKAQTLKITESQIPNAVLEYSDREVMKAEANVGFSCKCLEDLRSLCLDPSKPFGPANPIRLPVGEQVLSELLKAELRRAGKKSKRKPYSNKYTYYTAVMDHVEILAIEAHGLDCNVNMVLASLAHKALDELPSEEYTITGEDPTQSAAEDKALEARHTLFRSRGERLTSSLYTKAKNKASSSSTGWDKFRYDFNFAPDASVYQMWLNPRNSPCMPDASLAAKDKNKQEGKRTLRPDELFSALSASASSSSSEERQRKIKTFMTRLRNFGHLFYGGNCQQKLDMDKNETMFFCSTTKASAEANDKWLTILKTHGTIDPEMELQIILEEDYIHRKRRTGPYAPVERESGADKDKEEEEEGEEELSGTVVVSTPIPTALLAVTPTPQPASKDKETEMSEEKEKKKKTKKKKEEKKAQRGGTKTEDPSTLFLYFPLPDKEHDPLASPGVWTVLDFHRDIISLNIRENMKIEQMEEIRTKKKQAAALEGKTPAVEIIVSAESTPIEKDRLNKAVEKRIERIHGKDYLKLRRKDVISHFHSLAKTIRYRNNVLNLNTAVVLLYPHLTYEELAFSDLRSGGQVQRLHRASSPVNFNARLRLHLRPYKNSPPPPPY